MFIEIPNEEVEKLLKSVFESYPEYSSPTLRCTKWKYDKFYFEFADTETGQNHSVGMTAALKGFKIMIKELLAGKIRLNIGINILDAGEWDSDATDALVQYAIFGEVKYG